MCNSKKKKKKDWLLVPVCHSVVRRLHCHLGLYILAKVCITNTGLIMNLYRRMFRVADSGSGASDYRGFYSLILKSINLTTKCIFKKKKRERERKSKHVLLLC